MSKGVRLTLDLSPRLNKKLEEMVGSRHPTKAGVFRDGIELLEMAFNAREEGFTVGAWKQDGDVLREQVFII